VRLKSAQSIAALAEKYTASNYALSYIASQSLSGKEYTFLCHVLFFKTGFSLLDRIVDRLDLKEYKTKQCTVIELNPGTMDMTI